MSRFHLAAAAIRRVPRPSDRAPALIAQCDAHIAESVAMGVREQLESTQYVNLSFEERLGVLVDREAKVRDSRRLALRLKQPRRARKPPWKTLTSARPEAWTGR
jgi:hypothetical protein